MSRVDRNALVVLVTNQSRAEPYTKHRDSILFMLILVVEGEVDLEMDEERNGDLSTLGRSGWPFSLECHDPNSFS